MSEMARIKVDWTGFIGAPGYTNLYFRDFAAGGIIDQAIVDASVLKVDTWLDTFQSSINNTVSFLVNPTVDIVEETNGELVRFMTAAPDTARVGTQSTAYSAVSGVCVNWYTDGVRNGRRVRGRSFIVPLNSTAYGTDGTIDTTKLTAFRNAATTLANGATVGDLGVWSRPSGPGATDGVWHVATSATINDKAAILTSRRD